MQLSFHSLLASAQEVDFFTDILLETDLPCELDHSTLATLESIPEIALVEEEQSALEEQLTIEIALDLEQALSVGPLPEFEIHSDSELRNIIHWMAQEFSNPNN